MTESGSGYPAHDDSVSPIAVLKWLARKWLVITAGVLIGLLVALTYHFAAEERFTARLDFAIPESPVGTPTFVQQVARSFLEQRHGGGEVSVNPATGTISLVSGNLSANRADDRLREFQDSLAALRDTLNAEAASRYEAVQQDMRDFPDNTAVYGMLYHYRTYVSAQEAGLFDQIQLQYAGTARQGTPLANTVALGVILGGGAGLLVALALSLLSSRRKRAAG